MQRQYGSATFSYPPLHIAVPLGCVLSFVLQISWENSCLLFCLQLVYTPLSASGWSKKGAHREDEVEGAEEQPFEPRGFPVQADERVESSHQGE